MNGKNYWLWTFVGKLVAIYEIDPTRSKDVPKRIIGGFKGNVTSDSYSAWNYVGKPTKDATFTISERLRYIQYKNPGKEFTAFAARLKRILYTFTMRQKSPMRQKTTNEKED